MIRRAEPQDAGAIAELYERSFATLSYLPVLHTSSETAAWLRRVVAEQEVWVWEEREAILGFMALAPDELSLLYLEPGETGRGGGSRLLARAKERRPEGFTLWTFQQNEGARRFYERHGLRAIRFGDGSENEERVPDVQYAWRPEATP
jgi:GNAT superfamily N-acetyltransferase